MFKLSKHVQIESIVIKGRELLDPSVIKNWYFVIKNQII